MRFITGCNFFPISDIDLNFVMFPTTVCFQRYGGNALTSPETTENTLIHTTEHTAKYERTNEMTRSI